MFNKIFLLVTVLFSFSHAVDEFSSERLLGIEVGYTSLESENAIGINETLKNAEFGLKIGTQNEEWRTQLIGNFFTKDGVKSQKVMLQFDHFVWSSLYKIDNIVFKPYLGGHIGWMKYTDDVSSSDNSMVYGGQLGVSWNVLNEVDFDLGYRYSVTNIEKLSNIGTVAFGVNYIY